MKTCPKCNILHSKAGTYCSRKCANGRIHSEETKNKISSAIKGKPSSLKGKPGNKHTEESKLKISQAVKRSITAEARKIRSDNAKKQIMSDETKQKLREAAKRNNLGGHNSKTRINFIKNDGTLVYLQSSYEIEFAKLLEELNIDWSRPDPFKWIDSNGNDHKYYPDFKVGDIYIDTKNDYLAIADLPKINAVKEQNKIDLRIVTKDQINKEFIGSLV